MMYAPQQRQFNYFPKEFQPGANDVLIGRGKICSEHIGSKKFFALVASKLDIYKSARSKMEKSFIIASIVSEIESNSSNGGFLKYDHQNGLWFQAGVFLGREKTSQAFRNALNADSKSNHFSKNKRNSSSCPNLSTLTSSRSTIGMKKRKSDKDEKMRTESVFGLPLSSSSSSVQVSLGCLKSFYHQQKHYFHIFDDESLLDEVYPTEDTDLDHYDFEMTENNENGIDSTQVLNGSSYCNSDDDDPPESTDLDHYDFEMTENNCNDDDDLMPALNYFMLNGDEINEEVNHNNDETIPTLCNNKEQLYSNDSNMAKYKYKRLNRSSNHGKNEYLLSLLFRNIAAKSA